MKSKRYIGMARCDKYFNTKKNTSKRNKEHLKLYYIRRYRKKYKHFDKGTFTSLGNEIKLNYSFINLADGMNKARNSLLTTSFAIERFTEEYNEPSPFIKYIRRLK